MGSPEVQAVYIQLRAGRATDVREHADGAAFSNYDSNGDLLGIELLAPCKVELLNRLTRKLPQGPSRAQARQLIRKGVPGGMLVGAS